MKRYLLAIVVVLTFGLCGGMSDSASECVRKVEASFVEATRGETERNLLKEYGNDIFRTATDFSPVAQQSRSTSQQSSRRHNIPKEQHHASTGYHQGHATNIFNYNIPTALQSVVYYLHTLCRLRI